MTGALSDTLGKREWRPRSGDYPDPRDPPPNYYLVALLLVIFLLFVLMLR